MVSNNSSNKVSKMWNKVLINTDPLTLIVIHLVVCLGCR